MADPGTSPGFLDQPGFADAVRAVMTDLLALPPALMDYIVQYNALNGLPIPVSQLTGFSQFSPTIASRINTDETTTSATYTDLATVGPQLTELPNGKYLLIFGATISNGSSSGWVSVSANGTSAADTDGAAGGTGSGEVSLVSKSLSAGGSNTVTLKYRSVSGTSHFSNRWLAALKYANL